MGSIGNIYEVTISHIPQCTCPDFQKNDNVCKHILFVYLKVLKVPRGSETIYQKALISSELEEIFNSSPKDPKGCWADKTVRDKYNEIMGKTDDNNNNNTTTENNENGVKQKIPEKDDFCPICYEEMTTNEALVYCKASCGNSIHKDCFNQWDKIQKSKKLPTTCVYCRADWLDETKKKEVKNNNKKNSDGVKMKEGYINLSNFQHDLTGKRETILCL